MDFDDVKYGLQEAIAKKPLYIIVGAILLVLLAIGTAFLLTQPAQAKKAVIELSVYNESELPIEGVLASLLGGESTASSLTNNNGVVRLEAEIGKEYNLSLEKEDYEKAEISITVDKEKVTRTIVLRAKGLPPTTQTIIFQNPAGLKLEGKPITAELSCSNPEVEFPEEEREIVTNSGQISITPPVDCGLVQVRVNASGYSEGSSTIHGSGIIKLEALEVPKGTAKIIVSLADGGTSDNIRIRIYDESGLVDTKEVNYGGFSDFSLSVGSYYALAEDSSADYSAERVEFEIEEKKVTEKTILLSKRVKAKIVITVLDAESKNPLEGASVYLKKEGKTIGTGETDESGTTDYALKESGFYIIIASKEGYITNDGNSLDTSLYTAGEDDEASFTIALEKCTPSKCGAVKARVLDEDNLPVANARVSLYDAETDFLLDEHGFSYTDSNGYINPYFRSVKEGRYYAMAFKYPATGKSDPFELSPLEENLAEVKMVIGNGTVNLKAIDGESGKGIPFAEAELFAEGTGKIGTLTLDSEGMATYSFKADRKIYAIFSKDGYTDYLTESRQIMPSEVVELTANMEKEILFDSPKIVYNGIFGEDGEKIGKVSAGGRYYAKFTLYIPEDYDEVGFFLEAGKENLLEKDMIEISSVNAPAAWQVKGTSYTPFLGEEKDLGSITNGKAKWVTASWDDVRKGMREIRIGLDVKAKAPPGYDLPLFYRAYARNNNSYTRDPFDSMLGSSESTSGKQGLYAETYKTGLVEGAEEKCDGEGNNGFCFGIRITDNKEGVYLENEPFHVRVFDNYLAEFTVTNNDRTHDNSDIRIRNSGNGGTTTEEKLSIESYTITNADAQNFSGTTPYYELSPISLGNYTQNKTISGRMVLQGKELGSTALYMEIISSKKQVFTKSIPFGIVKEDTLEVTVKPDTLPAFTPVNLVIEALVKGRDEKPAEGALVKVFLKNPDKTTSGPFTARTRFDGNAAISLTPMQPGTKITIEIEKAGYAPVKIEKEISERIVEFEPAKLEFNLNLAVKKEEKKNLTIKNLVESGLKIKKAYIKGQFMGALDEDKMNNWLENQSGNTLDSKGELEISVVAAASKDAARLDEPQSFEANLFFELENNEGTSTSTFIITLPINIKLDLAEKPKEENCLEVDMKEWKTASLTGKVAAEFYIKNNCRSNDNKPLDLKNLQAKAEWKGKGVLGNIELTIQDREEGEATEVLPPSVPVIFFEKVPAEREYTATIIFTPKNGSNGKIAEFDLKIWAELSTSTGRQKVSESVINSEITIVELGKCIKFTPQPDEGITIHTDEEEASFDVDTKDCGELGIDFWLCKDDDGCTGGASEGRIEVKPEKFSLSSGSTTKTITVKRGDIPGMYGIPVYVKSSGIHSYYELKTFDVEIEPDSTYSFELDRYEFSTKYKPKIGKIPAETGIDSATLTNNTLAESISVNASICDWGDAKEKVGDWPKWFNPRYAGYGLAIGALYALTNGIAGAAGTTMSAAEKAGQTLEGAQELAQTSDQSVADAATATKEAATAAATAQGNAALVPGALTAAAATCSELYGGEICCPCAGLSATGATAVTNTTTAETSTQTASEKTTAAQGKSKTVTASIRVMKQQTVFNTPGVASNVLSNAAKSLATQEAEQETVSSELTAALTSLTTANTAAGTAGTSLTTLQGACTSCPAASATVNAAQASNAKSITAIGKAMTAVNKAQGEVTTAAAGTAGASASILSNSASIIGSATAASSGMGFWGLMGTTSMLGFIAGGLYGGLMDEQACNQRYTMSLMDFMINLVPQEDRREILPDNKVNESYGKGKILAEWSSEAPRVIGELEKQKLGIIFKNDGISEPKPVYATFKVNAVKHIHADETKIDRGDDDFGPWNVPDSRTLTDYGEKFHLKFKTKEEIEELPEISLDTQSCVSGEKVGVTGKGALPKVKFDWSWKEENGISWNSCDAGNKDFVYCDATQFTIELSKRFEKLHRFFEANPGIPCPPNNYAISLAEMMEGYDTSEFNMEDYANTGCWIDEGQGLLEGIPSIIYYVDAHKDEIDWSAVPEISDVNDLMNMVYFKAYLIEDGYSADFVEDFDTYYRTVDYADTDDAYTNLGNGYGVSEILRSGKLGFTQRYYDDTKLPTAGLYQVLLNIDFDEDGIRELVESDGTISADTTIVFYRIKDPSDDSAFYYIPFDGLVGLEGGSFNRQGYGAVFENYDVEKIVFINNGAAAMKTFPDAGSNPVIQVNSKLEDTLYALNTSPGTRGSLLIVDKSGFGSARLSFLPSKATPALMKVTRNSPTDSRFAAFYNALESNVPTETGSSFTRWTGAGKCLDFAGMAVFEAFNESPDRAASPTDIVTNWKTAYGVEWQMANYSGDEYLKTIVYTNPKKPISLEAESTNTPNSFITPDSEGKSVVLNGISGMQLNDSGTAGIGSIADVFTLVGTNDACMTNTGRRTTFFWNPKEIYDAPESKRNIEQFTKNLSAGKDCIGAN